MVKIILNNQTSRVVGDAKVVHKLHTTMKIKSPGYFFSTAWRERRWDGYIKYVTEAGNFMTGLLFKVIDHLKKWKVEYELVDNRDKFKPLSKITKVGAMTLRDYQLQSVEAFLSNRVAGVPFLRGILQEATNAGKNLIAAGIFMSFSRKRRGLFLIDNTVIFTQAIKELNDLMPGEVGQVSSGKMDLTKRVTVCMVQTLAIRIKKDPKVRQFLLRQDIMVIDECDTVASRKDTKLICQTCSNVSVRCGMSGTPLLSKDKTRNELVLSYFGDVVHTTKNKELVEKGHSSKPTIRIYPGNTTVRHDGDYKREYRRGIIKNRRRNKRVWKRASVGLKRGQVVILVKYHSHIDKLIQTMPPKIKDRYSFDYIHHKKSNKDNIIKKFNAQKLDLMIASMIIRRGLNIKTMRTLINAAGGDSHANTLQIFGRGLRKEAGIKEKINIDDFMDMGKYLQRHSKHRIRYYKGEGFPVEELYK